MESPFVHSSIPLDSNEAAGKTSERVRAGEKTYITLGRGKDARRFTVGVVGGDDDEMEGLLDEEDEEESEESHEVLSCDRITFSLGSDPATGRKTLRFATAASSVVYDARFWVSRVTVV